MRWIDCVHSKVVGGVAEHLLPTMGSNLSISGIGSPARDDEMARPSLMNPRPEHRGGTHIMVVT
jgi:hypothetical protein